MSRNRQLWKILLLVGVLVFFLFALLRDTKDQGVYMIFAYTENGFSKYDRSLCVDKVRKNATKKSKQCPQGGIVTAKQAGRLGNQIWEYASVWTLAKKTGLEPYVPSCIRNTLDQMFEDLSISTLEDIGHCPLMGFTEAVDSLGSWKYPNQSIVLPYYAQLFEDTLPYIQELRKEFRLKTAVAEECQEILHAAANNSSGSINTFVGVHVRRTDYFRHLEIMYQNVTPADSTFFWKAMEVFEKKYDNVIFVIISDDMPWCRATFVGKDNVYISEKINSPVVDMALMASCNHTIYDYGTYGDWGSLLAGGDTIYYNLSVHPSAQMGKLIPNWMTLPQA